jgi:hypothetical protein
VKRLAGMVTLLAALFAFQPVADAHLATFGSWEITESYLKQLFPEASRFLVKSVQYTPEQVAQIEATLGFKLYPEDVNPTFYIAVNETGGKQRFLGVAIFIDPRIQPKMLDGAVIRLEVGVAVDARGQISGVRVFDYRGNLALTRPDFLNQLNGMKLGDEFKVGTRIRPVAGEEEESQLVANAAHEALYLMKVSLGKKSQK